jgi:competence protein ComEC
MSGIFFHNCLTPTVATITISTTLLLVMIYAFNRKHSALILLIANYCFLLGGIITQKKFHEFDNFFLKKKNNIHALWGIIYDIEEVDHPQYNYKTIIKTCNANNANEDNLESFYIHWYHKNKQRYAIGDQIYLKNIKINKSNNEKHRLYLCKEGINAVIFGPQQIQASTTPKKSHLQTELLLLKNKIFATKHKGMTAQSHALYHSLFLGNKTPQKKHISHSRYDFNMWGISHYLARSGLHLVIFVALWSCILRLMPLHFFIKECITLLLVIGYWLFSWPSISFMRAFWMFLLSRTGRFFGYRINIASSILLVAFVTLLLNPLHLYFLDFQLSFLLTFALAWISSYKSK